LQTQHSSEIENVQCTLLLSALEPGGNGSSATNAMASLKRSISVDPQVGHLGGLSSFFSDTLPGRAWRSPPPGSAPPASGEIPKIDNSRRSIRT
jgi:hypothetical protein